MKRYWHWARALLAYSRVVRDTKRLDEVLKFVSSFLAAQGSKTLPMLQTFRDTTEGARAIRDRTRIGRIDLGKLATLPPGTLGHELASHMQRHGLDPAALPVQEAHTDEEYIIAHLNESHDVWHVVTGLGTDDEGEQAIQAFYLAQSPSRVALAILSMGFANTLLYALDEYAIRMNAIARAWFLGRRAHNLLGVDWKTLWSTPLAEVRARYNIDIDAADRLVAGLRRASARGSEEMMSALTNPAVRPAP
jgi:ubiquinone biosynthesis protein COQ4